MVDPKDTNRRTVESESGLELAARKVWVQPRLESFNVAEETMVGNGNTTADGGGAGHSLS
ncbi:MAG TPA: hypothetical protein VGK33_11510 [Chloroflexota bacterium]|jgi:hypothetical protein